MSLKQRSDNQAYFLHSPPLYDWLFSMEKSLERFLQVCATTIVHRARFILLFFLLLLVLAVWATSQLKMNTNQLDLLKDNLKVVRNIKKVLDASGGSGQLIIALRHDDANVMRPIAEQIVQLLDVKKHELREVRIHQDIDFIKKHVALLLNPNDLQTLLQRLEHFAQQTSQHALDFDLGLQPMDQPHFDLQPFLRKFPFPLPDDLNERYFLNKKKLLIFIKPIWDNNHLGKTKAFVDWLDGRLQTLRPPNGAALSLRKSGLPPHDQHHVHYAYLGSYADTMTDSFSMMHSLNTVAVYAFLGIAGVVLLFFHFSVLPSVLALLGLVWGTLLTLGFCYLTQGGLNLITSILAAILMGFGIDYGIHLLFRLRLELLERHQPDLALYQALVGAGRPALIAAMVNAASFFVLCISDFKGFSQFGFLAGFGCLIVLITIFAVCGSVCSLLVHHCPQLFCRWLKSDQSIVPIRLPSRGWLLGYVTCSVLIIGWCSGFAVGWQRHHPACQREDALALIDKWRCGIRFDYNTHHLAERDDPVHVLDLEVKRDFGFGSDPVVLLSPTLKQTKAIYDALAEKRADYNTFASVLSLYSFLPSPQQFAENLKLLAHTKAALAQMGWDGLLGHSDDPLKQLIVDNLNARPFGLEDLPASLRKRFVSLASAHPDNRGYLTYIYPGIEMGHSEDLLKFVAQAEHIRAGGKEYTAAGLSMLYAQLIAMVLRDGPTSVLYSLLLILLLHGLDFRSVRYALISVLPLLVGLVMSLGALNLMDAQLNFMNMIMLPILLGFGVSHGLYLLHRVIERKSMHLALPAVGMAILSSTLTALSGFASLLLVNHRGLYSMGLLACVGLLCTLWVSSVLAACFLCFPPQQALANTNSCERF